MRVLILTLLLTGCATGDWNRWEYGPAQWLEEKGICKCPVPYTTPKRPVEWEA